MILSSTLTGKSKEREDALNAGKGPLQGELSKYGRNHKEEEQRQGTYKCHDLG
jgi:hypothetical protein